jgi:hypothetical protein
VSAIKKEPPLQWTNRLIVLGSNAQLQRFQKGRWDRHLQACHCVLLQNSPHRFACQYETAVLPLERLRDLSRRWPRLVLTLHFESEQNRLVGLAKAHAGELEHCEIPY